MGRHADNAKVQEYACGALYNLGANHPENQQRIMWAGCGGGREARDFGSWRYGRHQEVGSVASGLVGERLASLRSSTSVVGKRRTTLMEDGDHDM